MLLAAAPKFFSGFAFEAMVKGSTYRVFSKNHFSQQQHTQVVLSLVMGFFDGGFIALLGPIAFELCGPQGASQAIG